MIAEFTIRILNTSIDRDADFIYNRYKRSLICSYELHTAAGCMIFMALHSCAIIVMAGILYVDENIECDTTLG